VLLARTPAIRWHLEDLKHLGVDATPAEGLGEALGAVEADRSDNFDRNDQAGRKSEIHRRPSKRLFNLAKGTIARIQRHRTRHQKVWALLRHAGPYRCAP